MTALAQRIKETPMAPYIGLMQGMSRQDIDIVVTFLNEVRMQSEEPKKTTAPDNIVEMVRSKLGIPESPETTWFLAHARPAEWNKQEEWDKLTPGQQAFAKRLKLDVQDMDARTVGLITKYQNEKGPS